MQTIWIALIALALLAGSALALGTAAYVQQPVDQVQEMDEATKLAVDCYRLHAVWLNTEEDSAEDDVAWRARAERGCWP